MKKIILLLAALSITLILAACGEGETKSTTPKNDPPAHVHAFGEWSTAEEATCTEKGSEKRTCECGETEERETEMLAHAYSSEVTAPTCEADGYTTYECECGDTYVADTVSKLEHDLGEWQTTSAATCTEDGSRRRDCKNCDLFETETLEKLPHSLGGWKVERAATCGAAGEERNKCKSCSYYDSRAIAATGNHTFGVWTAAATKEIRSCSGCSATESRPNLKGITSGTFVEAGSVRNDPYVASSTTIPYRRQGGCFTGNCIYQALITKNEETARVMKKDLRTGKTTLSECVPMGHANDMTYNSKTNCVYVVTSKTMHVFDADTLEYKGTQTLSNGVSGISYNAFNDTYVGFGSGTISIFGSDLKKISSFKMTVKGDSTQASQGICSDENYIYSLYYGKSNMDAYVYVYDYSGNYITTIRIDFAYEPENVSVVNGTLYVGICTTQPVFTVCKLVLN